MRNSRLRADHGSVTLAEVFGMGATSDPGRRAQWAWIKDYLLPFGTLLIAAGVLN